MLSLTLQKATWFICARNRTAVRINPRLSYPHLNNVPKAKLHKGFVQVVPNTQALVFHFSQELYPVVHAFFAQNAPPTFNPLIWGRGELGRLKHGTIETQRFPRKPRIHVKLCHYVQHARLTNPTKFRVTTSHRSNVIPQTCFRER
jgi:hypothetical protein